ncbi:hypothetical protein ASD81_21445 [Nocardioides sp. Root614]|nr:hypothetical protein ASD81_21445 [Nocardioides sp. Root614]KRA88284.1 hypothetical protein ASD84_20170 [Nocardioides sp. Root682]
MCTAGLDEGERFCGECGAYVDWSDNAHEEHAPVAVEPDPVPAPVPDRGRVPSTPPPSGPPTGLPTGPPPSGPPPTSGPPSRPVAPVVVPKVSTAERPDEAPAAAAVVPPPPPPSKPGAEWKPPPPRDALQAMVVPVTEKQAGRQPGAQQPAPQKPGTPLAKPKRPRPPVDDPIQQGDLVCGNCGIGNKPTRKFCRRCGTTLAEAVVAKLSWWRRWRNKRRLRKVKHAGARPRAARTGRFQLRFPTRLLTMLLILGALSIGGYAFRDVLGGIYGTARDRIAGTEEVNPTAIEASSSQRGHGPEEARDGVSNEYWAPAKAGDGRGEKLNLEFEDPIRLVYVIITPGITAVDEELFLTQGRPKEINAVVKRSDGTTEIKEFRFEDKLGPAKFSVGVSDVVDITFEIRSAYQGTAAGSHTAIAEVEFQARK